MLNAMASRVVPLVAVVLTLLATIAILLFLLPGLVQPMPQSLWLVNVRYLRCYLELCSPNRLTVGKQL
jgi:hypothetical protein